MFNTRMAAILPDVYAEHHEKFFCSNRSVGFDTFGPAGFR